MTNLTNVIVSNGDVIAEGVAMVKCGCAVDNNELDLCAAHKKMTEQEAIVSINEDYGITVETTTEGEETMTKTTPFQAIKEKATSMGVDIKGLRSIKAVQEAIDAFVASQEEAATEQTVMELPQEEVVEPVAVELDYTSAISEYATDLLTLVSNGTDYKTLAQRVSVNAYSILGAQALSGVELTKEQKTVMARHSVNALTADKMLLMVSEKDLATMPGTQLYIFALKLKAKPKLKDIEALRASLIALRQQAVARQPKASEASRANTVSTHKPFSSAQAVKVYPNAVAFIADGKEYVFIINPQGKGVLRHGNSSCYMQAKYLKGLLYNINTRSSRALVKAISGLRATKPSQVGGAPAKEKNSTATKQQDTMSVRYNNEVYSIPTSWYQQFVTHINTTGHKGSITAAMIVDAWTTRK